MEDPPEEENQEVILNHEAAEAVVILNHEAAEAVHVLQVLDQEAAPQMVVEEEDLQNHLKLAITNPQEKKEVAKRTLKAL